MIFKVNFPPNMIIPYPTFISLPGNFHPIPLFHTIQLFDVDHGFLYFPLDYALDMGVTIRRPRI